MVAIIPALDITEGRFAWNGMPVRDARTPKAEIKTMHPLLRGLLTLFAMMGLRLDLYRHKSYILPAVLIFISGQVYLNWFIFTSLIEESQKAKIVMTQALSFPFMYYFFLCTFPTWTFYLKKIVGDRMVIIIFNLGMGSLWIFLVVLFQLLKTYDPYSHTFDQFPGDGVFILGSFLFTIGWVIKFWASYILGVAAYFYADMIHRQPLEGSTFNMIGPYKWFKNPMYGVGYIGAYGYGLIYRSPLCLVLAAVMHLGVWIFNVNVEQVWVKRIYPESPSHNSKKD